MSVTDTDRTQIQGGGVDVSMLLNKKVYPYADYAFHLTNSRHNIYEYKIKRFHKYNSTPKISGDRCLNTITNLFELLYP